MDEPIEADQPEQEEDIVDVEDDKSESDESTLSTSSEEGEESGSAYDEVSRARDEESMESDGMVPKIHRKMNRRQSDPHDWEDGKWTWDSRSEASSLDEESDEHDDWYPLREKELPFPDYGKPTDKFFKMVTGKMPIPKKQKLDYDTESMTSYKNDEVFEAYQESICPHPNREEMCNLVLDYLITHGYGEPIVPLCREMGIEIPTEELKMMYTRVEIKNSIETGNVEVALQKMGELCPMLLEENSKLNFAVRQQFVVEMIRSGETERPLMYAREHLINSQDGLLDEETIDILEKTLALIAYDVNDESPFHYLYEQSQRVTLAATVNSAILGALGKAKHSRIDMMAKTLVWAKMEKGDLPNAEGEDEQFWARKMFEESYGMEQLVQMGLEVEPLDFSRDLC